MKKTRLCNSILMHSTLRMGWSQSVFTVGLQFTVEQPNQLTFKKRKSALKCSRGASLLNESDCKHVFLLFCGNYKKLLCVAPELPALLSQHFRCYRASTVSLMIFTLLRTCFSGCRIYSLRAQVGVQSQYPMRRFII